MATLSCSELEPLCSMGVTAVLSRLVDYVKANPPVKPISAGHLLRWNATVQRREFGLLLNVLKLYGARLERGGCGAFDAAIYLFGIDFKQAVECLRRVVAR